MRKEIIFVFALLIGLVSCSEQKSEVAQLLQDKISKVGVNYGEVIVMETATGNIIEKICLDKDGKPYEDNFNDEDIIVIVDNYNVYGTNIIQNSLIGIKKSMKIVKHKRRGSIHKECLIFQFLNS